MTARDYQWPPLQPEELKRLQESRHDEWWGDDRPQCERCEELIEEQWCPHGRDLCAECLDHCGDCQTEFAESRAYDDDRDDL